MIKIKTKVGNQASKLTYNNLINKEQVLLVFYIDYFSDLKIILFPVINLVY